MAQNPDGTATCDRCNRTYPGYGALYGMVVTDLDDDTGDIANLFVCNTCRPAVLEGLVLFKDVAGCSHCGVLIPERSVAYGLLAADLSPATNATTSRQFLFCKINGSRILFLDRLET